MSTLSAASIKAATGPSDQWRTPPWLWSQIRERYFPGCSRILDPCPSREVTLEGTIPFEGDGLKDPWPTDVDGVFMNYPFSDITPWILRAMSFYALYNIKVVCLSPCRTDQGWWCHEVVPKAFIDFIEGRINYINPETGDETVLVWEDDKVTPVIDKKTGLQKRKKSSTAFGSCNIVFDGRVGCWSWKPVRPRK